MSEKERIANELKLRLLIRESIKLRRKQELVEERKLRTIVRHLITEGEIDADTNPAPYASTPVNALADAFNQILPVLKTGLRKLAKPEERESYRAHVLSKFKSIFANFEGLDVKASATAIGEGDIVEDNVPTEQLKIKLDDPDRIMPSDGKEDDRFKIPEKDPEKELEDEFENFRLDGANPTGARVAFETISDSNIEQVLSDKRKLLDADPQYREEFKDYALYNADLWILTYEKELADALGQQPAFEETIVSKPSGATVAGSAQEFDTAGATEFGSTGGDQFNVPQLPDLPEEGMA